MHLDEHTDKDCHGSSSGMTYVVIVTAPILRVLVSIISPNRLCSLLLLFLPTSFPTLHLWFLEGHTNPLSLAGQLIPIPANNAGQLGRRVSMKNTNRSFQNTLSKPSSLVSSSVTPPNNIPTAFAPQRVIVHPLRRHGA